MTLDLLTRLDTVTLDEMPEDSALLRRFDAKYLVPLDALPAMFAAMPAHVRALEVEGRRSTRYASVYFDSPDLRAFRDHLQGRRRRYKIRTRRYEDAAPLLEVKLKGARQETVKERFVHPGSHADVLDDRGVALVRDVLAEHYDLEVPGGLAPVLATRYRRSTLVDLPAAERITIDRELQIVDVDGTMFDLGTDHAVVEVKSRHRNGPAHRLLRQQGLRPERLSKYCLGVTAVRDEVRGNPWLPVLRRMGAVAAPHDRDRAA